MVSDTAILFNGENLSLSPLSLDKKLDRMILSCRRDRNSRGILRAFIVRSPDTYPYLSILACKIIWNVYKPCMDYFE